MKLEINLLPNGGGSVILDGVDVSHCVANDTITIEPGQPGGLAVVSLKLGIKELLIPADIGRAISQALSRASGRGDDGVPAR